MLKKISVLLCVCLSCLLCGCMGYRETNQGLFVTAMCFESTEEGYNAAIEVIYSSENESGIKRELLYSTGATPAICMAAFSSGITRELYFEHCGAIIINEAMPHSNIDQIIDYCKQLKALNLSSFLVVTPDINQLLEISSFSGNVGFDVMNLMKRIRKESEIVFSNRIYETQKAMQNESGCALPRLSVKQNKLCVSGERIYLKGGKTE